MLNMNKLELSIKAAHTHTYSHGSVWFNDYLIERKKKQQKT